MERQAQKAVAISNAKQAGLALLMYSQDYDETLPTGDDINTKLAPYLKNTDPLDGFSYTYPGGKLGDIANPSETVLGIVSGPGGHAIVYADGHVRWKDD
jgi:prepilin-type processing-associated H-X9-DG protein